jgi:site-specific recombinase XerD
MSIVPSTTRSTLPVALDASWTADRVAAGYLLSYSGHTRGAYRRDLTGWFGFCTDLGVDPLDATRAHVDAFARQGSEIDGLSPTTVARKLSCLSGFYRYAVNEDVIGRNPVAAVRRPKVGSDTTSTGLDREELSALLHAAIADGPRSAGLVALLGFNGLRISEALAADIDHLDTERGHRVLRITRKGGNRATVPLAPRTAELLDSGVKREGNEGMPEVVRVEALRLGRDSTTEDDL